MKKLLLTVSLLLIALSGLKAQDNLWPNPGFEKVEDYWGEEKLVRWVLGGNGITSFNFSEDAHTGVRALKIFPTSAETLTIYDEKEDWIQAYSCKVGDTFTLSYWHKGDLDIETLEVTLRFYEAGEIYNSFKQKKIPGSMVLTQPEWGEHKVIFTIQADDIPDGKEIDHFDILLTTSYKHDSPQSIILDDFKLVRGGGTPEIVLDAPMWKDIYEYEHEIELSWVGHEDNEVTWEIVINDGDPVPTDKPEYLMYNLVEGTSFTAKVCAVKGEVKSPYSQEKKVNTRAILKGKDDDDRLPHLRTISPDGSVQGLDLLLFYNNLYDPQNATITYTIDGNPVVPTGNVLRLPKMGKQVLNIHIEEGPGYIWDLTYQINAFN